MSACEHCKGPIPASLRRGARYCSRNCQKRRWDNVKIPCPKCGGPMARRKAEHCKACEKAIRLAGQAERYDDLAKMWNEGASQREIADYLGYGPNSTPPELSRMMALGMIQARRAGYREKHAARP